MLSGEIRHHNNNYTRNNNGINSSNPMHYNSTFLHRNNYRNQNCNSINTYMEQNQGKCLHPKVKVLNLYKKTTYNVWKHIHIEPTVVYYPRQSRVERLNIAIAEKSKAMITESNLPKNMWSELVLVVVYTINRCLMKAIKTLSKFGVNIK
uniref:Integrase catalytic domain-containing protein n=1 Tax=Glossina pallidipes TaxID=7398 RepID=A0A1A9ZYQ7_GLOPL